jgi:hypothetical protein
VNKEIGRYECENSSAEISVLCFLLFKCYRLKSKKKTAPRDTENILGAEETLRGIDV